MKQFILIAMLGLLFISCSQNKQATSYLQPVEEVHRYATVYEGNRIIKYDLDANTASPKEQVDRKIEPIFRESPLHVERTAIQKLPRVSVANRAKNTIKPSVFPDQKEPEKEYKPYSNDGNWFGTHPGTIAMILFGLGFILSVIATIIGFVGVGILFFAIFLASLVFAIIGAIGKNSKIDTALAWTVLIIHMVAVAILIIALIAFFALFV